MNTQTNHTPGPWINHENGQINSKENNIAQVYSYKGDKLMEEFQANARLIAVAPELLDLCKACLFILKGTKYDITLLEQTIAKAEGV